MAVLSHFFDDGTKCPIAYASRVLTPAEKNYSQLEKEGLAIIFGVKKLQNYLYVRQFIIESDHQPLSSLFSEFKGTSPMASSRIQRLALTLSTYHYNVCYKVGSTLSNAQLTAETSDNHGRSLTMRSNGPPFSQLMQGM